MTENPNYDPDYCYECGGYGDDYYQHLQYYSNTATRSVRTTVSDAHFTSIVRSVSWDAQAIRAS